MLLISTKIRHHLAILAHQHPVVRNTAVRFKGSKRHHNQGEEHFIAQALNWMREKKPKIMIHVDKAPLTGCSTKFLPHIVGQSLQRCAVQIKCLTHADLLSDTALTYQIQLAEQQEIQNRGNNSEPVAIFALALSPETKQKAVSDLASGIFGATQLVKDPKAVVCGLPNSGKSSLILPLTKERTMKVRKKKEHHLPKVSIKAGRTLGMKAHIFEPFKKCSVSLMDSPGLRPRLEDVLDRDIALLLAARMVEPFKDYKKLVGDFTVMDIVVRALNRHGVISHTTPDYVAKLGLDGPTEEGSVFVEAFREHEKRSGAKQHMIEDIMLIRKCHEGEFGGMIFGTGPIPSDLPKFKFNRNYKQSAIVYMNEQARRLVQLGKMAPEKKKKPVALTTSASANTPTNSEKSKASAGP
jgi:hypothetical protein